MDFREVGEIKTVKKNQLIAVKYFPKEGASGRDIRDNTIMAEKGNDRKFNAVNNVKAVSKLDKILYFADIEGRVVLVGDSGISVNQAFEIRGNVDFNTGNIDFNGDVSVKGSVNPGFKVKAAGDIHIQGMVNQDVELYSNGNIHITQGVIGRELNTRIYANGVVIAQYIQSAIVESNSDIIVNDYIMNSVVKCKGRVILPQKESIGSARGAILGGEITAMKGVTAFTLGSDSVQNTKIVVGIDYEFDNKLKNFQKGVDFCENGILKISKSLRLGYQDMKVIKERIAKLPKDKQKPFLEAFKKLNELETLRKEIISKKERMLRESQQLSQITEVLVKKQLFPRVYIQIGDGKTKTENLFAGVKLRESKNRKDIEFHSIEK